MHLLFMQGLAMTQNASHWIPLLVTISCSAAAALVDTMALHMALPGLSSLRLLVSYLTAVWL